MMIRELLLADFDSEMAGTRTTLARIPAENPEFRLHEKSMPMGKLAAHVSTLPHLGTKILATPALAVDPSSFPPMVFVSTEKLLADFDALSAETRAHLASASDEHLEQNWKMTYGDRTIADAPRYVLFRRMFFNHLLHHRAQLGVYLRLNNQPLPPLYGPTADATMGF